MKIFETEQIRHWDEYTIEHEPIASKSLMNRAALQFTDWFTAIYKTPNLPVLIVCGTGNNGGDGIAVARELHYRFFEPKVLVLDFTGKRSPDFEAQIGDLPESVPLKWLNAWPSADFGAPEHPLSDFFPPAHAPVVDAIFGSGLTRPPAGDFEKAIAWLNALPNEIVSIDLPSGLFADAPTPGPCARAKRTFSFQTPKRAFFFPENAEKIGHWSFGNIGLHPDFEASADTAFHFLTNGDARSLYRPRQKFDHKGSFGHALLVGGSFGKIGAVTLAAKACLRGGAGLLTVHAPRCGYEILQTNVSEAMCSVDPVNEMWSLAPDPEKYAASGVGPGIGTAERTARALEQLLKKSQKPLVLDADALNLLAKHPDWWAFLPKNSILTPHPKEFERLFGPSDNDFARNDLQRKKAHEHGVFIVLKGAHSAIACPDGSCWFNSTGNPGMATGGSGDVLTGLLTGLLAAGYEPKSAALLGVFLHGLAGDLAAQHLGQEALIAGDLLDFLPRAWKKIEGDGEHEPGIFDDFTKKTGRGNLFSMALIWLLPFALLLSNCQKNPYSDGETIYKNYCANCHLDNGEGLGALIPPLAGADFLKTNREKLPCIVRNGLDGEITVNGKKYTEKMPGTDTKLTDVEITNVLNFVNNSWGNSNGVLRLEEVREVLKKCEVRKELREE